MIRADEIHARVGTSWPQILVQLGIPEASLRNKHGPCPACGGKDRFRFDNKRDRGTYICGQCGAGDGFGLLERVYGWTFAEARKAVIEAAGLADGATQVHTPVPTHIPDGVAPAVPPDWVRRLRRDRCAIENCEDAITYLASRGLWPLPPGCALKAHATVEYRHEGQRIGRYPALVADVVDIAGELVTCHVTWLQAGKKLAGYEPRKTLSRMIGREGCAVRLMPAADVLGIAEGIETALSAAALDGIPVWAALNTSLLSRFKPPAGVLRLRVYGDRDLAGITAASKLLEGLQDRIRAGMQIEIRTPPAPSKDWNDVLTKKGSST
jgi:putative DNA primase/helicase